MTRFASWVQLVQLLLLVRLGVSLSFTRGQTLAGLVHVTGCDMPPLPRAGSLATEGVATAQTRSAEGLPMAEAAPVLGLRMSARA